MIGLNSRDMAPAQQEGPRSDKFQKAAEILHLIHSLPTPPRMVVKTHKVLSKQAGKIAHQADQHEQLINKITYLLGVLAFGSFCYLLGARPQEIPHLYCSFFIFVVPLRWVYYRIKKWHYYLLDFCYYANAIFVTILLFFPNNEKLYMLCFSFSEGPLAWALIVWRCSLVFNSIDKTISVLIHLLPGTVFFILRWWDPINLTHQYPVGGSGWPVVESASARWTWLFGVPLLVYVVWQALYFLVVEGVRRQRISRDPEIKTSYRELKRKAERAKNVWWRLSGLLGDEKRVVMYAVIQAAFTVATLALTVPMFTSYRLHMGFEVFKLSATVWNGGNFVFDVMPRMQAAKSKGKGGHGEEGAATSAEEGGSWGRGCVQEEEAAAAPAVKRSSGGDQELAVLTRLVAGNRTQGENCTLQGEAQRPPPPRSSGYTDVSLTESSPAAGLSSSQATSKLLQRAAWRHASPCADNADVNARTRLQELGGGRRGRPVTCVG